MRLRMKKAGLDLWIIAIITLSFFLIYMINREAIINTISDRSIHVLARTLYAAFFQFGIAGLGVTVVFIFRKESPRSHGLNRKNIFKAIILSALCVIPYLVFLISTSDSIEYLLFKNIFATVELESYPFFIGLLSNIITVTVWGFFEGFNYIVISDKINIRYPSKNKFLNWGAIVCALACILIHGAVGIQLNDIIEMLTIFFMIYSLIIVKEKTGNAFGTIFVFIFFWNSL